ncbi:MAG: hypothetical protein Q4F27_05770, partial [Desulfovibrionaceae bacterium]|nr:hypothetical protein [Desulfovibrionaceae bacterium]
MKDDPVDNGLARGASFGLRLLSGVGRRLLVHAGALLIACLVALSGFGQGYILSAVNEALAIYVGLICLVPRGEMSEPAWYLPTCTGLAQGLVLFFLGYPLALAVFFGGLQTWLQRLVQSGGELGWEWTVSPMLLICLFGCFQQAGSWRLPLEPLWSIPLLGMAGWAGSKAYFRLKADAIHQQMAQGAVGRLQAVLAMPDIPAA